MGYLEGVSARGLALQRSCRKVGRHSPGAQKHTPGNGWLEEDLVQIIPREGEAVRDPLWSKPMYSWSHYVYSPNRLLCRQATTHLSFSMATKNSTGVHLA